MSDDRYIRKAFDIGEIPDNIDLSLPPATGFDYLYRVRLETRKCPKVVVSDIDKTKFTSRQTVRVDVFNGFIGARPGFKPDPQWQEEQVESFRSHRQMLSENRKSLKEKFPKKEFPKKFKEEDWCLFCLGSIAYERIFSEENHPEDAAASPPKSKKSRLSALGHPPLLSIMLYLSQAQVTLLLTCHVDWLEEVGFSHAQGMWFYALLACLEKPLDPDTCAILRSLARLCSKLRNELSTSEHEFLHPLNLILTIIAQYFDQKDMSDSFMDN